MICCTACDSNTAFPGYQEQKIFFSSHPLSLRTALRDNLVEWFEPEIFVIGLHVKKRTTKMQKCNLKKKKSNR